MAGLRLSGLSKRFGATRALDALDLAIADGEFVAILGPSGCGKTTLLRLIAGFEAPDAGSIHLGETLVSGPGIHVPAERRRIGIVFQSHALWPHMTVAGNVGYPLRVRGVGGEDYRRRIGRALATVGLAGFEERRPGELSGGQRQRVALARCLVMEPRLVLMDEPLASLDVHLRAALQAEFASLHKATGATMVYITHDQGEAMALADRIAVLEAGRLQQVAPPPLIYREPASAMVARFVGAGAVIPAEVIEVERDGMVMVEVSGRRIRARARNGQAKGRAPLCLRPEDLRIAPEGEATLPGEVRRVVYQGGRVLVEVIVEGASADALSLYLAAAEAPEPGQRVALAVHDGWIVPERLE